MNGTEPIQIGGATLHLGDCREVLAGLPAGSVHCCVTSPPYWGLRDYEIEPGVWPAEIADCRLQIAECRHEWAEEDVAVERGPGGNWTQAANGPQLRTGVVQTRFKGDVNAARATTKRAVIRRGFCRLCGAWRGCLGLEPTPDLYVAHLITIFREVRRVLRDDGTLWLNLGDSYSGSWSGHSMRPEGGKQRPGGPGFQPLGDHYAAREPNVPGLKPKDLCMMPARVAMALQADGWYLRSQIPWLKRNAMPESTTDRPATAVEYVFLLTKSARYFYDGEAVRAQAEYGRRDGGFRGGGGGYVNNAGFENSADVGKGGTVSGRHPETGRSRRNSDWFWESWQGLYDEGEGPLALVVNPAAFKDAHFATFPPGLVEPCLLAGTSAKGCCPSCGAPWRRVVESERTADRVRPKEVVCGDRNTRGECGITETRTLGWQPTCGCGGEPVPCTVLDPFSGAGTVGLVANRLGRASIGIEVKAEYVDMAAERIAKDRSPATHVSPSAADDLPLFAQEGS